MSKQKKNSAETETSAAAAATNSIALIGPLRSEAERLQGILEGLNLNFAGAAHTLDDGFKLLESAAPQAVFVDPYLPNVHDEDTVTQITAKFPNIPVVVVSSRGDAEIFRGLNQGAKAYLRRPFTAAQVELVLHKLSG